MTITAAQIAAIRTAVANAVTVTEAPGDSSTAALESTLAMATTQAAALVPTPIVGPPPPPVIALSGSVIALNPPVANPKVDGFDVYVGATEATVAKVLWSEWENGLPTSIDLSKAPSSTEWGGTLPIPAPGVSEVVQVSAFSQAGEGEKSNAVTYTTPNPSTKVLIGWFHDYAPIAHVDIMLDFAYGANSTTYTQAAAQAYTNAGQRLMLKAGLLTQAETIALCQECIAGGQEEAILIWMWEGNQDVKGWFPAWNETAESAAAYVTQFNNQCAWARSVPGAKFTFAYCPNVNNAGNQGPGRTQFDTAPGAATDVVYAPDGYDYPKNTTASAVATYQPHYDFAIANGYVWGGSSESGCNGSDNPAYVTGMIADAKAKNALWYVYFDAGPPDLDSNFDGAGGGVPKPNAKAAYIAGVNAVLAG